MAKIFRFKTAPVVEDLTIPEIQDGSEGWLVTGSRADSWVTVHEGHDCTMTFPNVKRGIKTYNLQSCTCIIYTALKTGTSSYRGAWLYHGKGGYLAKLPMPWEVPGGLDLTPDDCFVAFSAWIDHPCDRGLVDPTRGR